MKNILMVTVLLLATVTLATAGGHGGKMGQNWQKQQAHWQKMAIILDLTPQQQQQITQIVDSNRQQQQPLRQQVQNYKQALQQQKQAPVFNEVKLRAAAQQLAQVKTEMMINRMRMKSEIQKILTPQQQEKMAKLRKLRKQGKKRCGKGKMGQ